MRALVVLLFLLTGMAPLSADEVSYQKAPFHFAGEDSDFEKHVIRPSLPYDVPSADAPAWLDRVAAFVRQDAIDNGYINDQTREHYEQELAALQSGRWPVIFITKKDSSDIIACVAYAVRSHWNEALPLQKRFPNRAKPWGDLSEGLIPVVSTSDYRRWVRYPELNMPSNYHQLLGILALRPWGFGDVAEVKFLTVKGSLELKHIQVLLDGTVEHELARFGRIPMSKEEYDRVRTLAQNLTLHEWNRLNPRLHFDFNFMGPDSEWEDLGKRFTRHFREHFYDDDWQPYARISHLYIQVSGPSHLNGTARAKRFIRAFGFPDRPEFSFEESAKEGTPGIHTDVFKLSVPAFELVVGKTLQQTTGLDLERVVYYEKTSCAALLSSIEGAISRHVGR